MLIYPELKVFEYNINPFSLIEKQKMESYFIQEHLENKQTDESYQVYKFNYKAKQHLTELENLYSLFLVYAQITLGRFTISHNNRRTSHVYIANKYDNTTCIHNHVRTSIVNSVFYFSVPSASGGELILYDDSGRETWHKPKENTLLIFPSTLNHFPQLSDSEQYRIAINMELNCEKDIWNRIK